MKKNDLNFELLFGDPTSLSEKFHDQTKIKNLPKKELPESKWPSYWKDIHFKEYPRLPKVLLPEPSLPEDIYLVDVLNQRKSKRNFQGEKITLYELSTLLFYVAGNKPDGKSYSGNRFYPSAGSRYPLEVYIISQNTDLETGLYHYSVKQNILEQLLLQKKFNLDKYFPQEWFEKTSIIFITTAVFGRTTIKYGQRGYRHVLHETGSLIQNLYLVSTALNLKCCPTGAFIDDNINKLLDIDGLRESVVSVVGIGK